MGKKKVKKKVAKKAPKKKAKEKAVTKKNVAHVAFILDRSGSMYGMRQEAVDAFNENVKSFKEGLKGSKIRGKATCVTFATEVDEPLYLNEDLDTLKEITLDDYGPGGMTAMLDAVATTVDKLLKVKEIKEEKATVLLVIISDGMENNSKQYDVKEVAERLQKVQKTGLWTVTYAGANQDLVDLSKNLCIPTGNMQNFVATAAGMRVGTHSRCQNSRTYARSLISGQTATTDFYDNSADGTNKKK